MAEIKGLISFLKHKNSLTVTYALFILGFVLKSINEQYATN